MATTRKRATRRVARERKHAVRALINIHELTKAGTSLTLEISAAGEKIGQLDIGRGGLFWWGGRRQRRKRLTWTRFAEIMNERAYGDR
jgi:hypothetical protein